MDSQRLTLFLDVVQLAANGSIGQSLASKFGKLARMVEGEQSALGGLTTLESQGTLGRLATHPYASPHNKVSWQRSGG
jgi:hypothetical protein